MRILADENMHEQVVEILRDGGHDVLWVVEERPKSPDPDVLDWATRDRRLLITFDKDFGELSQRNALAAPYGIILFRVSDTIPVPERVGLITQSVNAPAAEWAGNLWSITIRKRPTLGQPSSPPTTG